MNQEEYNWMYYNKFCDAYSLRPFKGLTISLFRIWLTLPYGRVMDIEGYTQHLTNLTPKTKQQ